MTTAPILSSGPRVTEPICPSWCAGHNGVHFQQWEEVTADSGETRDHGSQQPLVDHVSVECCSVEDDQHRLAPATVTLFVDNISGQDVAELTPTQAMDIAKRLLDAAEKVALHNQAQR